MPEHDETGGDGPRERKGRELADWSAAGWVTGFVVGWLIFDSLVMGLLYAIIFGVTLAAAPRENAD